MKFPHAIGDVRGAHLKQTLNRELLDRERSHRGSVDDGAAQACLGEVAAPRQVPHEAAGEGITGARRIEDVLERIRRREENFTFTEHERAVLALLDDHELGAAAHDPSRRLDEVVLLGQLARLALVDGDQVDTREELEELGTTTLDPEVHRIAGDELGSLHLGENVELQPWIDVAEKDKRRAPELIGNLRTEVGENAEMGLERFGDIQVMAIAAAPAKRASVGALEAGEVHAALRERLKLLHWIVAADDADELHAAEMTRRRREESRRAAENIIGLAEGRFDGIQGDGSDHEK